MRTVRLEVEPLVAAARERAGLVDLGDEWLLEPLAVLLRALETEAKLSPAGREATAERIITALTNRLRLIEALHRHPEIADERLNVVGVVVGLPRTGSTLLHRLLASTPRLTAVLWWESQYPVPFEGEARGESALRRAAAERLLSAWLEKAPELTSITPIAADEPDEEVLLLDQVFLSAGWEAMYFLPSYSRYVEAADKRKAYADLVLSLKFLQWQSPERRDKGWILKSPAHLSALREVLDIFADSRIIMPHRDPVSTVPSFCSMEATLYGMSSDQVDPAAIGAHWSAKLQRLLRQYIELRDASEPGRFIDVYYEIFTRDPAGEVRRVLSQLGIDCTPEVDAALARAVEANARDKRARHHYEPEKFGLSRAGIERDFSFYRERFGLHNA